MNEHELFVQSHLSKVGGRLGDFLKEDVDIRSFYNRYEFPEKEDELLSQMFQRHFFLPGASGKTKRPLRNGFPSAKSNPLTTFPLSFPSLDTFLFRANISRRRKKGQKTLSFIVLDTKTQAASQRCRWKTLFFDQKTLSDSTFLMPKVSLFTKMIITPKDLFLNNRPV